MDATRIHLVLNYLPLIGTLACLLSLLFGFWKHNEKAKRIGLIASVLAAVAAIGAFGSGEVAGKGAEQLAGPVFTNIVQHKTSAIPTFIAIEAAGILALIGLISIFRGKELARWNVVAVLLFSLASSGLTTRTTILGRQIYSVDPVINK
jgi:uncharacterized membrane protein